jgi:hypothetical protein
MPEGHTRSLSRRMPVLSGELYVDKILKGASPANLPVEQPTQFDLIVNLRTASALSVTVPHSMLDAPPRSSSEVARRRIKVVALLVYRLRQRTHRDRPGIRRRARCRHRVELRELRACAPLPPRFRSLGAGCFSRRLHLNPLSEREVHSIIAAPRRRRPHSRRRGKGTARHIQRLAGEAYASADEIGQFDSAAQFTNNFWRRPSPFPYPCSDRASTPRWIGNALSYLLGKHRTTSA